MGKLIKFDTRDKKPKLWNVAILTCAAAAVITWLVLMDTDKHFIAACIVFDAYLLTVIVLMAAAFFKQLQFNPYSYNSIYYSGFSLFLLVVFLVNVLLTWQIVTMPEVYLANGQRIESFASLLLGTGMIYMYLSAPFILVFSLSLCISNISLIRHEGRRPVNLLGIALSFLLVGGFVFLYRFDYYASGSLQEVRMHVLVTTFLSTIYLYFECMLIGTIISNIVVIRYEPDFDKDFMIILGCGIRGDGTPTPLLRGRIDRAVDFRNRQLAASGKHLTFVTSGGQGPDEVTSESAAMKRYMIENGIPEEQIIEEDKSSSTFENMKFSKEKIMEANAAGKVAFATTNYHVFRSGVFARRVKMRAQGIGAKTKWYFWPNASVREFVGLLTDHRGKQALIFGGMLLVYILLVFYVYRP